MLILAALLFLHILFGTQKAAVSEYFTYVGVFEGYMNGAIRLLFPLIVTLLAVFPLQSELSHNFIALTRTRQHLAGRVAAHVLRGMGRNALYFSLFGVATTIASAFIAPGINPRLIAAPENGVDQAQLLAKAAIQNPLGIFAEAGPPAFGAASTLWMVANAEAFTLTAFASALLIKRAPLALLAPLGLYILESLIADVAGAPAWSFLASSPTPTSLQSFPIATASLPILVMAMLSLVAISGAVLSSYKSGRFS